MHRNIFMPIVKMDQALKFLRQGQPVALPTETVYGLAAPIDQISALEQIFAIKARPSFDPLIVHVESLDSAQSLAQWDPLSTALAQKFWPGPLTLILPKKSTVPDIVTSGGPTVGLRCPRQPLFLEILRDLKVPLAAPSANKFGKTSPTSAEHVLAEFDSGIPVLDGGPCSLGLESTVLQILDADLGHMQILRPGGISVQDLQTFLKDQGFSKAEVQRQSLSHSPGHLAHHYQPSTPVTLILDELTWCDDLDRQLSAYFKAPKGCWVWLDLSEDPVLAARELYSKLRKLSATGANSILCPFKEEWKDDGQWSAIHDRLTKAASLTVGKNLQNKIIFYSKSTSGV